MQKAVSHSNSMYQSATFAPPAQVMTLELKDYVRKLVAEMALNITSLESTGAIAVTNFVSTDL
ncbi:MAG: hypothetical protein ACI808_002351, partial [Paraglaciecola sp.]